MIELRDGRWWDSGSWWRYRLVTPVMWRVAGVRDRVAVRRARRHQDVIR